MRRTMSNTIGELPGAALAIVKAGTLQIERARELIAECKSVDEAKDIHDKAAAVHVYLRAKGAAVEAQNDAAEIALRAERRMGEMLKETNLSKGGRPAKTGDENEPVSVAEITLGDLGITKKQSSQAQKLADVPEEEFSRRVEGVKQAAAKLTASAVIGRISAHKPGDEDADRELSQWDTPPSTAKWLVEWAGVDDGMSVLEPSAGKGHIALALAAAGAKVTAVEIDPARANALDDNAAIDTCWNSDFLDWAAEEGTGDRFDMVVMNPPYENGQDLEHVLAALKLAPVVVVLARLVLLEGQDRRKRLWDKHALTRLCVLSERESFEGAVVGTPHSAFAAFEITRGPGESVVEWR